MSLFAPLPHNSPATAPPALSFLPSTPSNIITNSALKDGPPRKRQRSDDGPTPASSASQVSSTNAPALADVRRSPAPDPDNSPSMDDLQHREGRRGSIILEGQVESVKRDVAPFLSKHIPGQYNPQSATTPTKPHNAVTPSSPSQNNNSYCYRHRPDVKCRRQAADERAMEELQKGLDTLPPTDQQAITHVWSLFSAAPAAHRSLMLKGILAQCCFPQLSLIASSVRDLIRIDFLTALPPEISFKILSYLDTTSLCKAAQVSQRWRMLADDDVVWHRMCEQHIDRKCKECGWGLPLLERKRLRSSKRQIQLRASNYSRDIEGQTFKLSLNGLSKKRFMEDDDLEDGFAPGSPSKRQCSEEVDEDNSLLSVASSRTRPWKDVYSERYKVECNWRKGRCTMKVFKGHTDGVMCLQFDESVLATGSYDATLKIWDIESGKELRTLTGHTSVVRCLMFDDNKLISGSLDRTLKIWNWRTGECLSTLTGHTDGVVCLHFDGALMASGSIDKTVKIWNFSDKSCTTLRGHTNWVNSVRIDTASRTVLSASDDMTVRLWDLDSKTCIRVFEGHVGQVQQVIPIILSHDFSEPNENLPPVFPQGNRKAPPTHILTAALDSTMKVWEVSTGRCVKTLFGHVEGIWAVAADTLRLVSGAQDRMVKVWDVRTGKCQRTVTGHAGAVTCVGLSDSKMVTGSEDCEVRMYCFGSNGSAGWDTPLEEVGIEGHHDHANTEPDETME